MSVGNLKLQVCWSSCDFTVFCQVWSINRESWRPSQVASKICCYNVLLPSQTIMCASAAAESRGRAIGRQNIAKLLSNRYIYEKWERRNTRSKPIDKPFLPFSVFARGSRYLIRRNFFFIINKIIIIYTWRQRFVCWGLDGGGVHPRPQNRARGKQQSQSKLCFQEMHLTSPILWFDRCRNEYWSRQTLALEEVPEGR